MYHGFASYIYFISVEQNYKNTLKHNLIKKRKHNKGGGKCVC